MLDATEVAKHTLPTSCWVIISGNVYDVTELLDSHPGGPQSILRHAGRDATEAFEPVHPSGTLLRHLPQDKHLGPVDPSTLPTASRQKKDLSINNNATTTPISICQNLDDIEAAARQVLSRKAWAYYNSAADSLQSFHTNRQDWSKISFRPRILRNVARANMKRRVMGHDVNLPFFIAPAAMAKLGHPDGEMCLGRGAAEANIVYCASTYSSVAHDELATCFGGSEGHGALAFQLYVPRQKKDVTKLIDMALRLKCRALVVTVDTAVVGRREEDDRYHAEVEVAEGQEVPRTFNMSSDEEAPVFRGFHCSTLDWDDIRWIKGLWGAESGPVYIKGIQTAEDALLAAEAGVDGIYLSNHGGRQLDYAPSSIRTLLEIRKFYPDVLRSMEVYLDGGVRRGTDIVKALCLGATAVGLGRPFLYGLSAYGTDGVLKVIELLSAEMQTTMRLMGVTDVDQLNPGYLNCKQLERYLPDSLQESWKKQHKL